MMKKYGKYEKRPVETTAKQPKAKNMLLQTYLTSLLGMVLCMAMFLGTSYAWFSSEVTNTANEIYIGTLDVGLYKEAGETDLDLGDSSTNTRLLNENIRWEPGYTAIETVHVVNQGDLAFNYTLSFTDGTLDASSTLKRENVAKNFDVWVYHTDDNTIPTPTAYTDITKENSGWTNVGTLEDLLAGKPVLQGAMDAVRDANQEAGKENAGTTDGLATTHTYTIAVHMKKEANGNDLMGQRITLSVKLVAYQKTAEQDAFGNSNYDAIYEPDLLQVALNTGSAKLGANIAVEDIDSRLTMIGGTLDGNGYTLTYTGGRNESNSSVGVLTTNGGTVKNLTIAGGEHGRALYVTELKSDLVVEGCTLSGAYAFNVNSAVVTDYNLYVTGTTFESWTSYSNVMEHAYFTGCTFNDVLRPYGDTTLTDCKLVAGSLNTKGLEAGETITLVNCAYDGVTIDKATLTADEAGNITVSYENNSYEMTVNENTVILTPVTTENAGSSGSTTPSESTDN